MRPRFCPGKCFSFMLKYACLPLRRTQAAPTRVEVVTDATWSPGLSTGRTTSNPDHPETCSAPGFSGSHLAVLRGVGGARMLVWGTMSLRAVDAQCRWRGLRLRPHQSGREAGTPHVPLMLSPVSDGLAPSFFPKCSCLWHQPLSLGRTMCLGRRGGGATRGGGLAAR